MNFRQKITLSILPTLVLGSVAFAQVVAIPDPNLRAAVREALNIADRPDVELTEALMRRHLTNLRSPFRQITDLEGLQHATNITSLALDNNSISDLRPIATLTRLTFLRLHHNRIIDVSPLANLTQLNTLLLANNNIVDVAPLAKLANLMHLEVQNNSIIDHQPLNQLLLTTFKYDQTCDIPPLPLQLRLEDRTFPSIFASWGHILNQPHLPDIEKRSKHDLYICCLIFNQKFFDTGQGWQVRGNMNEAITSRDNFLADNPNMVFLAEIRMRDEGGGFPPSDSPDWVWVHDAQGNVVYHDLRRLINFTDRRVQDMIVEQALAVEKCGLYDGIFFDWWYDYGTVLNNHVPLDTELAARDNIVARIRATTRPDFLIMGNTSYRTAPRTGHFINGGFMESTVPQNLVGDNLEQGLTRVENSLRWLEQNLRKPRINALQGGSNPNELPDSPTNLRWMRAITTLSLTHSDGYVQFAIGSGHNHYWYDFWDADLGRPVGAKAQLYDEDIPGLYIREYTNGWAVYNHSSEAQVITLPEEVQGVASGLVNTEHALPNLDGEMYLRVKPVNPADVNKDGVVNILDLTIVAQGLGTDSLKGDVNGDGVINILDLVFVADQF